LPLNNPLFRDLAFRHGHCKIFGPPTQLLKNNFSDLFFLLPLSFFIGLLSPILHAPECRFDPMEVPLIFPHDFSFSKVLAFSAESPRIQVFPNRRLKVPWKIIINGYFIFAQEQLPLEALPLLNVL